VYGTKESYISSAVCDKSSIPYEIFFCCLVCAALKA
jgi:hypothetical protein